MTCHLTDPYTFARHVLIGMNLSPKRMRNRLGYVNAFAGLNGRFERNSKVPIWFVATTLVPLFWLAPIPNLNAWFVGLCESCSLNTFAVRALPLISTRGPAL